MACAAEEFVASIFASALAIRPSDRRIFVTGTTGVVASATATQPKASHATEPNPC